MGYGYRPQRGWNQPETESFSTMYGRNVSVKRDGKMMFMNRIVVQGTSAVPARSLR